MPLGLREIGAERCSSEPFWPQQGVRQVKQQPSRDDTGSWLCSSRAFSSQSLHWARDPGWVPVRVKKTRQKLKSFAGVGVAHCRHKEAEAEGQHDDVQHQVLLCVVIREKYGLLASVEW
jgi:hypothetical protein